MSRQSPRRVSVGDVFTDYTVIAKSRLRGHWLCRCSCGVQREVTTGNLNGGHSKSCGHARMARMHEAATKHGHATERTYEYEFWCEMRKNCSDPTRISYPDFGGKGIRVHLAWQEDFGAFLRDV